MQLDGEEETKGLAKRAIAKGLDVTPRKANVTFMRAVGAGARVELLCLLYGKMA